MSGTTPRRRHGQAGLLVIFFAVGGLIFSYGLGHAPVVRVCTEHAVSVPLGAVSSLTAPQTPQTGVPPLQGLQDSADAMLSAPLKQDLPEAPLNACLCLAVLFTLVLLGLATGLRRPAFRLPARAGWAIVLPSGGTSAPASRPSLQVLRL